MNRKISVLITVILMLFMVSAISAAGNSPPKAGSPMSVIELPMLNNTADLQYLGLHSGGKFFRINQVKAKVLILQICSM